MISLYAKCINERISLFDLTTLPFELYLHISHVLLAFSSSENRKAAEFLNVVFWKKKMGHPLWKVPLFCGHGFSRKKSYQTLLQISHEGRYAYSLSNGVNDVGFCWMNHRLLDTPISRCVEALCGFNEWLNCKTSPFLTWFNRCKLYLVACKISSRVIHLSLKYQGSLLQNVGVGNMQVSQIIRAISNSANGPVGIFLSLHLFFG